MRRIVVGTFLSLDGVMQAPGGPEEDRSGGFRFGGWTVPYGDEAIGTALDAIFSSPFDLLLGRRTYDIFAGYWPYMEGDSGDGGIAVAFNKARKYVATHRPESLAWQNSEGLGVDIAARLEEIKAGDGPDLLVQGSSELVHQLLAADLVDELRLLIYPLILGHGKRLFDAGSMPATLEPISQTAASNGVIIAAYRRVAGAVKTGSFGPGPEEIERRKTAQ